MAKVWMSDEAHRRLKAAAAMEGKSLTRFIDDLASLGGLTDTKEAVAALQDLRGETEFRLDVRILSAYDN